MKLTELMTFAAGIANATGCAVRLCPSKREEGDDLFAGFAMKLTLLGFNGDSFVSQAFVGCLPGERPELRCEGLRNKKEKKKLDVQITVMGGFWYLRCAEPGGAFGEVLSL